MTRGRKNPHSLAVTNLLPPCKVCGESATGFHYGVTTCTACKGFFRRSLVRRGPYVCLENNLCHVGPATKRRDSCPKCRYEKCVRVGMSVDGIKVGRYSTEKKSKYKEEYLDQQHKQWMSFQKSTADLPQQFRPMKEWRNQISYERENRSRDDAVSSSQSSESSSFDKYNRYTSIVDDSDNDDDNDADDRDDDDVTANILMSFMGGDIGKFDDSFYPGITRKTTTSNCESDDSSAKEDIRIDQRSQFHRFETPSPEADTHCYRVSSTQELNRNESYYKTTTAPSTRCENENSYFSQSTTKQSKSFPVLNGYLRNHNKVNGQPVPINANTNVLKIRANPSSLDNCIVNPEANPRGIIRVNDEPYPTISTSRLVRQSRSPSDSPTHGMSTTSRQGPDSQTYFQHPDTNAYLKTDTESLCVSQKSYHPLDTRTNCVSQRSHLPPDARTHCVSQRSHVSPDTPTHCVSQRSHQPLDIQTHCVSQRSHLPLDTQTHCVSQRSHLRLDTQTHCVSQRSHQPLDIQTHCAPQRSHQPPVTQAQYVPQRSHQATLWVSQKSHQTHCVPQQTQWVSRTSHQSPDTQTQCVSECSHLPSDTHCDTHCVSQRSRQSPDTQTHNVSQKSHPLQDVQTHYVPQRSHQPPDTQTHYVSQRSRQSPDTQTHYVPQRSRQLPDTQTHYGPQRSHQPPDTQIHYVSQRSRQSPDTQTHYVPQRSHQPPDTQTHYVSQRSRQSPDTQAHYVPQRSRQSPNTQTHYVPQRSHQSPETQTHYVPQRSHQLQDTQTHYVPQRSHQPPATQTQNVPQRSRQSPDTQTHYAPQRSHQPADTQTQGVPQQIPWVSHKSHESPDTQTHWVSQKSNHIAETQTHCVPHRLHKVPDTQTQWVSQRSHQPPDTQTHRVSQRTHQPMDTQTHRGPQRSYTPPDTETHCVPQRSHQPLDIRTHRVPQRSHRPMDTQTHQVSQRSHQPMDTQKHCVLHDISEHRKPNTNVLRHHSSNFVQGRIQSPNSPTVTAEASNVQTESSVLTHHEEILDLSMKPVLQPTATAAASYDTGSHQPATMASDHSNGHPFRKIAQQYDHDVSSSSSKPHQTISMMDICNDDNNNSKYNDNTNKYNENTNKNHNNYRKGSIIAFLLKRPIVFNDDIHKNDIPPHKKCRYDLSKDIATVSSFRKDNQKPQKIATTINSKVPMDLLCDNNDDSIPKSHFPLYKTPDLTQYALAVFDKFPFKCFESNCLTPIIKNIYEVDDSVREFLLAPCRSDKIIIKNQNLKMSEPEKDDDCFDKDSTQRELRDHSNGVPEYKEWEMELLFKEVLAKHDISFGHKSTYMTASDFKTAKETFWGMCRLHDKMHGDISFTDDDKYFDIRHETGLDIDRGGQYVLTYLQLLDTLFIKDVKFFINVPGYKDLGVKDRTTLLRSCSFLYTMIIAFRGMDQERGICINEENGWAIRMGTLSVMCPSLHAIEKRVIDLMACMKDIDLSHEEMVIFKILLLVAPYPYNELEEPDKITVCYQIYHKCLLHVIRKCHGHDQANDRFAKIMGVLNRANEVREPTWNFQMKTTPKLSSVISGHQLPLFKELF